MALILDPTLRMEEEGSVNYLHYHKYIINQSEKEIKQTSFSRVIAGESIFWYDHEEVIRVTGKCEL